MGRSALPIVVKPNIGQRSRHFEAPEKVNPSESLHIYTPENKRFAMFIEIVFSFHCSLTGQW
jgi:hypothetical protein